MNINENKTNSEESTLSNLNNSELAYFLLRAGLGINIFFHGFVRIPKLQTFAESMISKFDGSMLPKFMVTPMAYFIPIAEVIIGAGILLGIKTKLALTGNALLMFILIFGCCMIENFNALNSQMLVLFISTTLIATISNNRYTLTK